MDMTHLLYALVSKYRFITYLYKDREIIMTRLIFSFLTFVAFSSITIASNSASPQGDHPLVSRFADSHIIQYSETDYDEYFLPTGIALPNSKSPPTKTLEGKITTIIYEANSSRSSVLQVTRNFERSLRNAGFTTLFSCANKECGYNLIPNVYGRSLRYGQYSEFSPISAEPNGANFKFISASHHINNKLVYVVVMIQTSIYANNPVKIALDIIETQDSSPVAVTNQAKQAPVKVSISNNVVSHSIQTNISQYGRAVLDGIYFDSDMAIIKDKSHAALKNIADYLNTANPKQVYIVGHSDSTGSYDSNMKLSRKRARAVARQLYINYFVRKSQLKPVGVAHVAPISSNSTVNGRAKNRRVELVLTEA